MTDVDEVDRCPECGSENEHADWCLYEDARANPLNPGDGPDGAGVREPRRPRPSAPSAAVLADEPEDA